MDSVELFGGLGILIVYFLVLMLGVIILTIIIDRCRYISAPKLNYIYNPNKVALNLQTPFLKGQEVKVTVTDHRQILKYKKESFQFKQLSKCLTDYLGSMLIGANVSVIEEPEMLNVGDDVAIRIAVTKYHVTCKGKWMGYFEANVMMFKGSEILCEKAIKGYNSDYAQKDSGKVVINNAFVNGVIQLAEAINSGAIHAAVKDRTA